MKTRIASVVFILRAKVGGKILPETAQTPCHLSDGWGAQKWKNSKHRSQLGSIVTNVRKAEGVEIFNIANINSHKIGQLCPKRQAKLVAQRCRNSLQFLEEGGVRRRASEATQKKAPDSSGALQST